MVIGIYFAAYKCWIIFFLNDSFIFSKQKLTQLKNEIIINYDLNLMIQGCVLVELNELHEYKKTDVCVLHCGFYISEINQLTLLRNFRL